jgi:thioredoxin-dependent peroxiredoxin
MKGFVVSILMSGALAVPVLAALKTGESAPDFSTKASLAGKEFQFSLKDALKKGPVVVYFYPSAYTQGCNAQAHAFAESKEKFEAAGASIIGVSRNTIAQLNQFSADPEYCAGKFPVASDADGRISSSYNLNKVQLPAGFKDTKGNVIDHDATERTTFVVTPNGRVAAVFSSAEDKLSPTEHVNRSLAKVQELKAGQK